MAQVRFGLVLLLLSTVTVTSCDDVPLSSSVGRSSTGPGRVNDLTGTWAGAATDSGGQVQMMLQLSQTGTTVSGSVTATTGVGVRLYAGSFAGTLTANFLTFTVTVMRGGIVELPECSLVLTGSASDLQQSSIAGTYTGVHSCLGDIQAGRFLFVRH